MARRRGRRHRRRRGRHARRGDRAGAARAPGPALPRRADARRRRLRRARGDRREPTCPRSSSSPRTSSTRSRRSTWRRSTSCSSRCARSASASRSSARGARWPAARRARARRHLAALLDQVRRARAPRRPAASSASPCATATASAWCPSRTCAGSARRGTTPSCTWRRSTHLVRATMAELEAGLDAAAFARIHRGTLVRIDCVREVIPAAHGDFDVVLDDGTELRLSRRYRVAAAALRRLSARAWTARAGAGRRSRTAPGSPIRCPRPGSVRSQPLPGVAIHVPSHQKNPCPRPSGNAAQQVDDPGEVHRLARRCGRVSGDLRRFVDHVLAGPRSPE